MTRTFDKLWRPARIAFEGEGGAGGGGGGDTVPGGADTQPGGADTLAGGSGNDTQPGGGAGKWWEGSDFTTEDKAWIEARGLADEDIGKIVPKLVKGHRNAEIRLGRGVDQILDKPKEGQSLLDWQREQEIFGLPKTLDDVKIERPKDLPEGIAWDGEFETAARKAAFDLGLNKDQLQGMTALYAKKVQDMLTAADTEATAANTRMMADLGKEWGAETEAKLARARQAASVVGEAAGLDAAGIEAVSQTLSTKTGDAATIKLFAALGDMLAEDKMVGAGGGRIGMTPADARAKIAELNAPGGAMFEASKAGNSAKIAELRPEIERLSKIAAGGRA